MVHPRPAHLDATRVLEHVRSTQTRRLGCVRDTYAMSEISRSGAPLWALVFSPFEHVRCPQCLKLGRDRLRSCSEDGSMTGSPGAQSRPVLDVGPLLPSLLLRACSRPPVRLLGRALLRAVTFLSWRKRSLPRSRGVARPYPLLPVHAPPFLSSCCLVLSPCSPPWMLCKEPCCKEP